MHIVAFKGELIIRFHIQNLVVKIEGFSEGARLLWYQKN